MFRAIGYRGVPLPGVPFDERRGVIPNEGGRVLDAAADPDGDREGGGRSHGAGAQSQGDGGDSHADDGRSQAGSRLPGEYAVGWIKRGPSGVIGTNKKDAQETVDAILADASPDGQGLNTPASPDGAAVEQLLRERQPELVTYDGWASIDRHERALGEATGRPRVKLTRIEEMLRVAAGD